MNLAGTSTVKDWSMKAHSLRGEAKMVVTEDNQLMEIPALNFSLPVHNLKGEERLMDEDAYKALKADEYRDIVFTLTSAGLEARGDRHYLIRALGTLSVAGVTKVVNMKMHAQLMPDGTITVVGAEHLKMSDYNVERPSHLFGIVKAGDDMTLTYTLIFMK